MLCTQFQVSKAKFVEVDNVIFTFLDVAAAVAKHQSKL